MGEGKQLGPGRQLSMDEVGLLERLGEFDRQDVLDLAAREKVTIKEAAAQLRVQQIEERARERAEQHSP